MLSNRPSLSSMEPQRSSWSRSSSTRSVGSTGRRSTNNSRDSSAALTEANRYSLVDTFMLVKEELREEIDSIRNLPRSNIEPESDNDSIFSEIGCLEYWQEELREELDSIRGLPSFRRPSEQVEIESQAPISPLDSTTGSEKPTCDSPVGVEQPLFDHDHDDSGADQHIESTEAGTAQNPQCASEAVPPSVEEKCSVDEEHVEEEEVDIIPTENTTSSRNRQNGVRSTAGVSEEGHRRNWSYKKSLMKMELAVLKIGIWSIGDH